MASFPSTTTLILFLLLLGSSIITSSAAQSQKADLASRRNLALMDEEEEEDPPQKKPTLTLALMEEEDDPPLKPPTKKKPTLDTKNQTKLIKPKKLGNSTTTIKPKKLGNSTTTTIKPKKSNNSTTTTIITSKTKNKTLNATPKPSNSTKLPKPIKPLKSNSTKIQPKPLNKLPNLPPKNKTTTTTTTTNNPKKKLDPSMSWLADADGGDDLITEFRGLPSQLLPDLRHLSTTSKAYISRANLEITKSVKPYVGTKHASTVATAASAAFLLLPLLLISLLLHRLKIYLSLQRILISIQAYLAIYFATLALTALLTGLEPLRFFFAASPPAYALTQALQTLGYVVYLIVQLAHLVVVFSSDGGVDGGGVDGGGGGGALRALGLAQMVVGLAVGMHYYAVVFHRAVAGEPPRANWKVHAVYAACFVVICALARAERRKKAYFAEGGDDGKKS